MASVTDICSGATFKYLTGTDTPVVTVWAAEVLGASWGGISRPAIDTTHSLTANNARTFIPGDLYDPGELTLDLHLDQDGTPPMTDASGSVRMEIPNPGSTNVTGWDAAGYLTSFNWTGPLEDKMTATATVKFSDEITIVTT